MLHPVKQDAIRRDESKSNFSDNVRVTCFLTSCPTCWLVGRVITPYPGQRGREVGTCNKSVRHWEEKGFLKMSLSKALKQCSLARFDPSDDCSNIFTTARDLGVADTIVQINPGPGPRETFRIHRIHRILLGLNRANPLLLMSSEEAANFVVCSNHQHKLCSDPKKISTGRATCGSCHKIAK